MTPLEVATTQVGVAEATGQNDGIPFDRYSIKGEAPAPWCARFVRWCYSQSDADPPLPGNPWANASVAYMHSVIAGSGCMDVAPPQAGDIIFLHERGSSDAGPGHHVGIVEWVDATHVHSIEGNWGDKVARVSRNLDNTAIWGYGRWPFK